MGHDWFNCDGKRQLQYFRRCQRFMKCPVIQCCIIQGRYRGCFPIASAWYKNHGPGGFWVLSLHHVMDTACSYHLYKTAATEKTRRRELMGHRWNLWSGDNFSTWSVSLLLSFSPFPFFCPIFSLCLPHIFCLIKAVLLTSEYGLIYTLIWEEGPL